MTPTSDGNDTGAFIDGTEESSTFDDASMSYGGMHKRDDTESVTDGPNDSFDAGQILKDRAENLGHVDRDAFRRVPTFQESSQDNAPSSAGANFGSAGSVDASGKNQGHSTIMQAGVLVVLGAVAANVFGFRSSRWAVGKELFRAWERRSRRSAAREAAEAAARAAARAAAQTAARRAAEWARQASGRAASTTASGFGSSGRQGARSAFGFRNAAAASGINDNGRRNGTPRDAFDAAEEMLRELLRETERATGRSSGVGGGARRPRGMDAWEELFDEAVRDAQRASRNEGSTGQGVYGRWEWRGEWGPDGNVRWERMGGFGNAQAGNPFGTGQEQSGAGSAGFNPFEQVSDARYYRALGLQPGASEQEVKNAYRKLVMKWHPDRYRGNNKEEAERKFREITHAYEALTKR